MSAHPATTLWCDHPECREWYMTNGKTAEARKEARTFGWRFKRGVGDVCPEHAGGPKGKR